MINSNSKQLYNRAVLQLFSAALIWGLSFTLVSWTLEDFSTSTLVFWRFLLAFILGEVFLFIFFRKDFKKSHSDILLSAPAGFFLAMSILFQTEGLRTISATNSSFITSLYVIILPIVGGIFFKHKIKLHHLILGLTGFAGMALLLNIHNLSEFKIGVGEILTFVCGIAAAFHILTVGKVSRIAQSSFRFNNYQTFWTLLIVLPFLFYETSRRGVLLWPVKVGLRSVGSLVGLAILVSVVGFYLQIRAQKVLSTTTSSLLCLLEAPSASIFAIILMNEKINLIQTLGIALILSSSVFSVYVDRPKDGSG